MTIRFDARIHVCSIQITQPSSVSTEHLRGISGYNAHYYEWHRFILDRINTGETFIVAASHRARWWDKTEAVNKWYNILDQCYSGRRVLSISPTARKSQFQHVSCRSEPALLIMTNPFGDSYCTDRRGHRCRRLMASSLQRSGGRSPG